MTSGTTATGPPGSAGTGARTSDTAYRVYLAVLVAGTLVGPVLHTLVVWLATPGLGTLLAREELPALIATGTGLLLWIALAAGTVRGPVVMSPFRVHVVAGGPRTRRASLGGRYVRMLLLVLVTGTVLGALPGAALLRLGTGSSAALVEGALTGAGLAGVLGVSWLAGQSLSRRGRRWTAPSILAGAGAVALLLLRSRSVLPPNQAGWCVLAVVVAVALALAPHLLDRLRGPVLLEQAWRWRSATTAGGAGDLAAAATAYRSRPRRRGPADAVGTTRRLPLLFLRRDLVGAARTPVRSMVAAIVLCLGLGLAAWVAVGPVGSSWVGLALAFGLVYLALGVWSDGFRHGAEASAAPTLYGVSEQQLLWLHAALPAVLVMTLGTALGLTVVLLGQPLTAGALPVAGAIFCVAVRAFDAARGPMPVLLLTPVPTPLGDLSGVAVALWQADSLLVALIVPTVVTMAALIVGWPMVLAYLPACAALLLGLRHRLAAA